MDELRDIVHEIAGIWRMHKRQEALFKSAMALDITRPIRIICGNGYMTSLLYQSEIRHLYESLKCCLTDGDLASITLLDDESEYVQEDCWVLITKCLDRYHLIISMYQSLLSKIDEGSECWEMCSEHLTKIRHCCDRLARESKDMIIQHSSQASVA